MAGVFISHSSKDQKTARTICAALEHRGLHCWISERDVGGGENYQVAIVHAIRAAKVMILIFTANANASEEIKKELSLASKYGLTVIPVRTEDVVPSEAFELEFATRQWIDLFADWEDQIERLANNVRRVIPAPPPPPDEPAPASEEAAPTEEPVTPQPTRATIQPLPETAVRQAKPVVSPPRPSQAWLMPAHYPDLLSRLALALAVVNAAKLLLWIGYWQYTAEPDLETWFQFAKQIDVGGLLLLAAGGLLLRLRDHRGVHIFAVAAAAAYPLLNIRGLLSLTSSYCDDFDCFGYAAGGGDDLASVIVFALMMINLALCVAVGIVVIRRLMAPVR